MYLVLQKAPQILLLIGRPLPTLEHLILDLVALQCLYGVDLMVLILLKRNHLTMALLDLRLMKKQAMLIIPSKEE